MQRKLPSFRIVLVGIVYAVDMPMVANLCDIADTDLYLNLSL